MSAPTYPVRVDATLDPHLSRWLWLVKWLLAIPHFLVLALLWVAFAVLSVVALVAILFTGRYPRAIFEFNVGVLRWSWRVAYYAYDGLGTDRYPPFTLADRPDYPARLEIAYPERLSRGLVLVKWWLLAIPHYLVLVLFLGSGLYLTRLENSTTRTWTGGLIGLLVFFAAVTLLFTGRYPRPLFDLVLGLDRWVLRVAAYAALMTDQYPPFRLDLGGEDPATGVLAMGAATATATATATAAPAQPQPWGAPPAPTGPTGPSGAGPGVPGPATRWSGGRITAVTAGSVLAVISLAMLAGGLALRVGDGGLRDGQGYLMSPTAAYTSSGHAVTSSNIQLHSGSTQVDLPRRWLGTLKVQVDSRSSDRVFVGLARTAAVGAYLDGVAHSVVTDPVGDNGNPVTRSVGGGAPRLDPGQATLWAASAGGARTQTITWEPRAGNWTLVVMNADGSSPVAADVAVGAELPVLGDVAVGLLVGGTVLLLIGLLLIGAALRHEPAAR